MLTPVKSSVHSDIAKDHGLTLQWQDCVAHTSLRVWIYKLCIAQKNLSIYPYPQKCEWPHNFFAKTVNPSIQLLFAEYMLGIVYQAIYILWVFKASPHIALQAQKGVNCRVEFEALCCFIFLKQFCFGKQREYLETTKKFDSTHI